MKSQKPKPTSSRNARAPASSSPTSIPAPTSNVSTSNSSQAKAKAKDKQDERDEKLEDILTKWSSAPQRKSLPFLNDLHKVGRLYDNVVKARRGHSRERQFEVYDEVRGHLDGILRGVESSKRMGGDAGEHLPSTLGVNNGKTTDMMAGNIIEPSAPGLKGPNGNGFPWRRASPTTPTRSSKKARDQDLKMSDTQVDSHESSHTVTVAPTTPPALDPDNNTSPPQPPSAPKFSRPIPIRSKPLDPSYDNNSESPLLLPPLDLPLPPMRPIIPNPNTTTTATTANTSTAHAGDTGVLLEERHPHLKPMYTQSYVNGVVEAMKHAHGTIAKLSQEKREVESRLGVLEEKQKMWHALVHGQGCRCWEGRWWGEVEEGLIERRGLLLTGKGEGEGDKKWEGEKWECVVEEDVKGEEGEEDKGEVALRIDETVDGDEDDSWDILTGPVVDLLESE
ncbi:hypothetical protein B0T21DRAFT_351746 [Apiosordaria backusii]|uniref:Uncharacterized protein n=1 Tax=Apiosordaria backusii TaxID=314023 RepID=A0AA40DZ21_9PEZI|nr:hypothetical protein B0T21DRAFT_351746 [Apiosordaria backusii]